jgi:hypothetical protein
MTLYFLSSLKGMSFPEPLFKHHFFGVIFSSTILRGGNLYKSLIRKLSWCHNLILMWVLQTCLCNKLLIVSPSPSPAPLPCDISKNVTWQP